MKILVTGGLGYIGSHTVVELIKENYKVVIVDNLSNSDKEVLTKIKQITGIQVPFYNYDCTDYKALQEVFSNHQFAGIIHFAGLKSVNESVLMPGKYYFNNVVSTIVLAKLAIKYNVNKFIFSSSATVYGEQKPPLTELMPLGETINPYGETKKISERILTDFTISNKDFNVILLRYFNPIGAHSSALIGERPIGKPNNLMPYLTQTAKGINEKLYVFGNDYPTPDGTGIRDYIHVVDLAIGHIKALNYNWSGVEVFNLGTGKGTSVLQLIKAFEAVNKIKVPFVITNRRPGDLAVSYANVYKAKQLLKWQAKYDIKQMVKDSWEFEKRLK